MKYYLTRDVNASWIYCDTCRKTIATLSATPLATMAIRLETSGGYGRKGSRSLGCYCEEHGKEKLAKLRARRAKP